MIRRTLLFLAIVIFVSGCKPGVVDDPKAAPLCGAEGQEQKIAAPRLKHVPEETVVSPTASAPVAKKAKPVVNDGSWVITASSSEKEFGAGLAVDGSLGTRWGSEFYDDQFWMVDFGRQRTLEKITINWEDAHAKTYKVLISKDGDTWDEVYEEQNGSAGAKKITFEAQSARYVKIELGKRATAWGFSFFEIDFNSQGLEGTITTASSGNNDYAPRYAIDGDMGTRWSSNFGDHDWWQVQFAVPRFITGMKISWETAFTEKYEIAVSDDGEKWRTIYEVTEGDGRTDILFFEPVKTRYIRIVCNQRGTGWGNSIYEIDFFDLQRRPVATASTAAEGSDPSRAIDGNPETAWRSSEDGEQILTVELPESMDIGGVELNWGQNYPTAYEIEWSPDGGEQWISSMAEDFGNGGKDYVFFPSTRTRYLRVRCKKSVAGKGYELVRLEPKSGEEQATPLRAYQAKARDAARGRFLMWLTRQQEFWTVVGLPEDSEESLLGETGTFEPKKGAFSVQPFVLVGGKIWSWADVVLGQKLEKDYLPMPTATWKASDWRMDVSAVAFGKPGESSTAVRYRLTNNGKKPRTYKLILAVRPIQLNPVWQHGGMSPIHTAVCVPRENPATIQINDKTGIILPAKPEAMGAAPLTAGDVADFLARGEMPQEAEASDDEGKVSVGIMYELAVNPGESKDVVVLYPLHDGSKPDQAVDWSDPATAFDKIWSDESVAWTKELDRFVIDIPEERLIQTMKSNLGYVLINRDTPWFKPGSRNYNHGWIRDGALTGVAMLRLGKPALPGAFISSFSEFVNEDGWVPFMIMEDGQPCGYNPNMDGGEGHEFDSQGEFVFIVRQYYDFTGDKELITKVYPQVFKALKYGSEIRKRRLTDEYKDTVYEGILPLSNSHEGYYPAKHSYWDDFWMLRGWKDGAYLADQLGKTEDAQWMREEEEALRASLLASIMAVIKRDNLPNIPGCAELGDEDPTSTSIAIMACDETRYLPQPYLKNTFDRYNKRIAKRYTGIPDTFTPYEVRNADVFIRLGQRERALAMLRYFMKDSMRPPNWNHMAEVVHEKPRAPSYIGDMPHTWVGSDYINAVRSIFSFVQDDTLVLAAGVDPEWLDEGVTVKGLPTQYGKIDYTMKKNGDEIVFEASGDLAPPNGFELPLPREFRDMSVSVDGKPVKLENGSIRFEVLPVKISLTPGAGAL